MAQVPIGIVGATLAVGALGLAINAALFNVEGGHRAVKYSRFSGVSQTVYEEGTHFMIPWFERAIIFDARAKPRNVASLTGTKGLFDDLICRSANGEHYLSCLASAASSTASNSLQDSGNRL